MQPSPVDTEDNYVAYERNTKLLIAEVMKSRSKKETIILLLAETFPARRRFIQDTLTASVLITVLELSVQVAKRITVPHSGMVAVCSAPTIFFSA